MASLHKSKKIGRLNRTQNTRVRSDLVVVENIISVINFYILFYTDNK